MNDYAGYIQDLKTKNVLGIQRKSSLEEIEMNNNELIKRKKEHMIQFKVLNHEETMEYLKSIGKIFIPKSIKEPIIVKPVEVKKKPGKKSTKK